LHNNSRIPDRTYGTILRALPQSCKLVLENNLAVDSAVAIPLMVDNELVNISELRSAQIKSEIVTWKCGPLSLDIAKVHKLATFRYSKADYKRIWSVKNPTLRGIRLKSLYKDIYSNERRFRFGMSPDPNCVICGEIETVEHHLALCPNARKIWGYCDRIDRFNVHNISDVLRAEPSVVLEIIKAIAIKQLIQIDRSRSLSFTAFCLECLRFLNIELRVVPGNPETQAAIARLKDLLHS